MGATLDTTEWERTLEEIAGRADDITPVADEIHLEILRQSRSQAGKIRDVTGRLRASLTNPRSPDHIYRKRPKRVTVASRDPAAVFNPQYLPVIDSRPLVNAIADYVVEDDSGTS
jgi:hypothetical protein